MIATFSKVKNPPARPKASNGCGIPILKEKDASDTSATFSKGWSGRIKCRRTKKQAKLTWQSMLW